MKRSKFSSRMVWNGINNKIWSKVKSSPSLITATEVPFIPVLLGHTEQPYDALMVSIPGASSKRKRRSAVNYDMWGGN